MNFSTLKKIGWFLRDYSPEIFGFFGFVGLAVLDIFDFPIVYIFVVVCIIYGLSIVLKIKRSKSISGSEVENASLKAEIETLKQAISEGNRNYYEVWDDRVRSIFQECELSVYDRVSMYKHDTYSDEFRLLGRYAENSAYRKKNRVLYPLDKGVMGKAWEHGVYYEKALPNPENNYELYVERNEKKYGISREICEGLTMQATCLWAKSLSNAKNVPFALVVVESTKRGNIDEEAMANFFDGNERAEIENLLDSLAFMEPNLRLAQERGF